MTRAWWLRIAVGSLAGVSFMLAWTVERSSLERGNRLQRSGEYTAAAELYTERTRTDAVNAELQIGRAHV